MIKAIIFDADGVLIFPKLFSKEVNKDYGIPAQKILLFFQHAFKDCLVGQADLKQELGKVVKDWGWQDNVEKLIHYWMRLGSAADERMLAYVDALKAGGIKCYVATNQEKYRADYMREEMEFSRKFDGVWASSDIGFRKPQQEFYEKFYERMGVDIKKSEIMFWDDSVENVEAAARFGFESCLYRNFEDFQIRIQKLLITGNN